MGFWNGDTLVAWTANVQGWTVSHSMFEFSSALEIIEVFRPSADGKTITVEATFYDPEAFLQPLQTVTRGKDRQAPTIRKRGSRSWNAACRAPSSTARRQAYSADVHR